MRESTLVDKMDTRLRGYDTTSGKVKICKGSDRNKEGETAVLCLSVYSVDGMGCAANAYPIPRSEMIY